jgi:cysteinyl-tRNA synthetase
MLKLHNTLTKKKETFKPLKKGQATIYSCGPTVYWNQHIGNMRTMILADLLIRVLKYNKYKVKHVINYTDVGHLTSDSDWGEDKIEKAAKKEGLNAQEIAQKYIDNFESDVKKLNIEFGIRVKATEYIKEQILLIKKLEKKSFTYQTDDGIYFNTAKFKTYGKLSNLSEAKKEAGKRISLKEKQNKTDFALWKFSNPGDKRQQEWPSPWGTGFPGWHIECSAMSMKHLSSTIDIHTGGQDLSQIHHNNEIAQSEAATGKKFVNYWVHGGFLLFNNEKVSKSSGGLFTISELEEQGFHPLHYRFLTLQTHYKKPLNFTIDNLEAAKVTFERIKRKIIDLRSQKHKGKDLTTQFNNQFEKAINDDLNIPKALQIFQKALDDFNFSPAKKLSLLIKFDSVLGLNIKDFKSESISIPKEVKELIETRERLRKNKLWKESDIIRQRIKDHGFIIEDTPNGTRVEKI